MMKKGGREEAPTGLIALSERGVRERKAEIGGRPNLVAETRGKKTARMDGGSCSSYWSKAG